MLNSIDSRTLPTVTQQSQPPIRASRAGSLVMSSCEQFTLNSILKQTRLDLPNLRKDGLGFDN